MTSNNSGTEILIKMKWNYKKIQKHVPQEHCPCCRSGSVARGTEEKNNVNEGNDQNKR